MNLLPNLLPGQHTEVGFEDDLAEDPYHGLNGMIETAGMVNGHKEIPKEKYLVVMPSIRKIPWEYFAPLADLDIFVCDDSDGEAHRGQLRHNQWQEMLYPPGYNTATHFKRIFVANREFTRSYVGEENLWLFPNHNPSVKNIGLYYAVKEGYKGVILLDDDCDTRERHERDFFTLGRGTETWDWSCGGDWMNTLALISFPDHSRNNKLFARGFPYEWRTRGYSIQKNEGLTFPYFNEGLWTGHPDINGMDKLEMYPDYPFGRSVEESLPWWIDPDFDRVNPGQVALRTTQQLPLSIMNCQIHTNLIPAFYQPSDFSLYNSYKVRRHDDIWSMYFLRAIMGRLGLDITVGNPLIRHRKEGDAIKEALSEHYTNLIQPSLMGLIDEASDYGFNRYYGQGLTSSGIVAQMAIEMSARIRAFGKWGTEVEGAYLEVLQAHFRKTQGWAELFV